MKYDNFVKISKTSNNLDLYIVRNSIKNSLNWISTELNGDLLDIGCGKMPYKNYLMEISNINNYFGLDINNALEYDRNIRPDYFWDGINMPFKNESFDCAIGTEVLEHCPDPDIILNETNRVLKSGGLFFFTVPFLWNLHEVPNDQYRYTPFSIKKHLERNNFINIEIYAMGGWHASLAQMLALWVRRSSINNLLKLLLSKLLKPIILYLLHLDKKIVINFIEGQMITGLYGKATKK